MKEIAAILKLLALALALAILPKILPAAFEPLDRIRRAAEALKE